MADSPFNRSSKTPRSPPVTPSSVAASEAHQKVTSQADNVPAPEVITTAEIQKWMSSIEQCLNEVCQIATEGKLNSEQKMRISTLCRSVGHGTSQMAVQYQSLKLKAVQAHSTNQSLQSKVDLSQRLMDLTLSMENSMKPATEPSFADMVKNSNKKFIQPINLSSVVIYPNDKTKSSDHTKTLVQKIICPEELKLHVRGMRKTKNGGVIISTDNKYDVEKLKRSTQLSNSGLVIDEPHRRKPRVVVIGVPSTMQEKEVFSCLYNQNVADKLENINLETFLGSIKLSHKSGKKEAETCNYIIEVSPVIRKALITKDRLFINWSSCPVKDFTLVTRCYKCQQYGHAAKSCREPTHTCGHCGDLGHTIKECVRKTEEPKCASCLRYKKPHDHNTGAADCPAKIMAERNYIQSIDYGA